MTFTNKIHAFGTKYIGAYEIQFLVICGVYTLLLGIHFVTNPGFEVAKLGLFVWPAIELLFFCLLGKVLLRIDLPVLRPLARTMAYLLPLALALVYLTQLYSLQISGSFLTVLALENAGEAQYVRSAGLVYAVVGIVILSVLLSWMDARNIDDSHKRFRRPWLSSGVAALVYVPLMWAQADESGYVGVQAYQVPTAALLDTGAERFFNQTAAMDFDMPGPDSLPGFYFNEGAEFPFQKEWIYQSKLPFAKVRKAPERLNVITIFAEGFSARLMKSYDGEYPDLTPNMDEFAGRAMRVDNYYNHTAATFRGLQGQMGSGYPFIGGSMEGGWARGDNANSLINRHYQTTAKILQTRGYATHFFSPHPDSNQLNTMLRSLGFDQVYSSQTLLQFHQPLPKPPHKRTANDADVFEALTGFLKARNSTAGPFFAATYNIGTHAFRDIGKDGLPYTPRKNSVLNRMHNFDDKLGTFLDYFMESEYADNTILILTSDHATFPEPPYQEVIKSPNYQPYFIDEIPMIIHAPHLKLPKTYDAAYRTSIDFAPTFLQLLGINQVPNSFLGRSIFESDIKLPSVAALAFDFYHIDNAGAKKFRDMPVSDKELYGNYTKYIKTYYELEKENRIFKPE